jgi:hypothetical protein
MPCFPRQAARQTAECVLNASRLKGHSGKTGGTRNLWASRKPCRTGLLNEADGTRTRNHRIDRTRRAKNYPLPRNGNAVFRAANEAYPDQSPASPMWFHPQSGRTISRVIPTWPDEVTITCQRTPSIVLICEGDYRSTTTWFRWQIGKRAPVGSSWARDGHNWNSWRLTEDCRTDIGLTRDRLRG